MMRLIDVRSGLEVIDRDECVDLLATRSLGRVAVVTGERPAVFPVNYAMDDDQVVFRTAPGTKFDAAVRRAHVAFEVDDADASAHGGWSVIVAGWADELIGAELERARELPVHPWASGERAHYVAIRPERITGRRVGGTAARRPDAGPAV